MTTDAHLSQQLRVAVQALELVANETDDSHISRIVEEALAKIKNVMACCGHVEQIHDELGCVECFCNEGVGDV